MVFKLNRTGSVLNRSERLNFNENWDKLEKVISDRGLEILSESGFLTWLEKNGIKHREEVATFADLPSNDSLNTVRGVMSDNKIYIKKENGWLPFQSIDISKVNHVERKVEDISVNIKDFILDGETSTDNALTKALNYLGARGGGKIIYPVNADGYVLNNVTTSVSNVEIDFMGNEIRKEIGTGYQLRWEGAGIKSVVVKGWRGKGDNTQTTNAGLGFALTSATSHIDGLTLEDCTATEFAQYGINIGSVSNINIVGDCKILNHGSTHVDATIGIGFVIYPRTLEKNAYIEHIYARINPNSTLISASIKIQVTSNIVADRLHGVNGTESCISLDATDGSVYRTVLEESESMTGSVGLILSSNNAESNVTDASFDIEFLKIKGVFTSAVSFANDGSKKIRIHRVEGRGQRISAASNALIENCEISNATLQSVRLDLATGAVANGCTFKDVYISEGGAFTLSGNNNKIRQVKGNAAGHIHLTGNDNLLDDCENINSTASSFVLNGDRNLIVGGMSDNPTTRHVSILSGTGNKIFGLKRIGSQIIEDLGTDTFMRLESTDSQRLVGTAPPTSGSYVKGDYMENRNPSTGMPFGWVCTLSGSPGTWQPVGQNGVYASTTNAPQFVGQVAVVSGVAYIAVNLLESGWRQITN